MFEQIKFLAETLGKLLQQQNLSIATAECYTGGGLAYFINAYVKNPLFFDRGFIANNILAKQELLGVTDNLIKKYGHTNCQIIETMAEGTLRYSLANIGIAIGDLLTHHKKNTKKISQGLWFAWASETYPTISIYQNFEGSQADIRQQAIIFALSEQIKLLGSIAVSHEIMVYHKLNG